MPTLDEVRNALTNPNISSFPVDQQAQATRQLNPNPGAGLSLAASDPASFGGQVGSEAGNADYAAKFGTALQGLLKQYQTLGTKPFQQQALNASDAQVNASTTALTNPALQGYSPGTIMNSGQSAAAPFSPIIEGANNSSKTFSEQLRGFGDILNNAQNLLKEQQATKEKAQSQAQDLIHEAINVGSDAIAALMESQPELIKAAGYNKDTVLGIVTALKKTETKKSSGPGTNPTDPDKVKATPASVKAFLLANKKVNSNTPYYELWGKLSDQLTAEGINPSNFDQQFWEILHPEGKAGYDKYVKGKGGVSNPFQ